MIGPIIVLIFSLAGLAAGYFLPDFSDMLLVAWPSLFFSLVVLIRAELRLREAREKAAGKLIVIDGSNAMHWKEGTPQLATVREIVDRISALGYKAGVIFDANAGHILTGKYKHNSAMGKLLGLPSDRVIVVDKGTPADPTILEAARFLNARIVTNDRYRDWAANYPELKQPGYLIRGGYKEGKLWLELDRKDQ
ncbi:hypothetical protein QKW60_05180 [Defluviimonas aestuarii]|uniref:NYN domain-containing protein n=1 Tax=Albidovulum aestuarii TaxID=1130726 RepID=UPI00249A02D0|nr:hypothetical protein [Defluviimonas aestuarii]MDI3335787.1 hypothetical protein [Defluviimonas aestuarii]